jgi:hypothetical protein
MVDGAVSIAVRSVYPGKQAGLLLLSDVLQEPQRLTGTVACRALSSVGHKRQSQYRYQGEGCKPFSLLIKEVSPCPES